jgi:hypothetical protein
LWNPGPPLVDDAGQREALDRVEEEIRRVAQPERPVGPELGDDEVRPESILSAPAKTFTSAPWTSNFITTGPADSWRRGARPGAAPGPGWSPVPAR